MEIFYREKAFYAGKKSGKMTLPPSEKFSCYAPGVRLTPPKAGAFGENTISKTEGSLGEKPNFGSKLGALGENVTFVLSVTTLEAGI